MQQIAVNKCFGGQQRQYQHASEVLGCDMQFSVYLPPQAEQGKVPVLYWLSGLTCTDQNFVTKAGAQGVAARLGVAIVCPDTSPRGEQVPDDADSWDFGSGAGFYVNATQSPWDANYQMYDYVSKELPQLVNAECPVDSERISIFGHSMGGHGALTVALKNPDVFKSVSAFAPIVSPLNCPWGIKALTHYLGEDQTDWEDYDSCSLVGKATKKLPVLIDQGLSDNFLEEQLKTDLLVEAAKNADYPMQIRFQEGYDHSFFFIASFIEEHLEFHAKYLSDE